MYTPIEKNRSHKYGSNYWEVMSLKLNRKVKLFSDLEHDHWVLIESSPNIITFCEQPFFIKIYFEGTNYQSVPDMWIKQSDGTEFLVEIKYTNELDFNNPKNSKAIKKVKAYKQWCKLNNFKYLLRTEYTIRKNPIYLQNMKTILYSLKSYPQPTTSERDKLIDLIANQKMKISEIDSLLDLPSDRIRAMIYWLYYQGFVSANFEKQLINNQTEVWIRNE